MKTEINVIELDTIKIIAGWPDGEFVPGVIMGLKMALFHNDDKIRETIKLIETTRKQLRERETKDARN